MQNKETKRTLTSKLTPVTDRKKPTSVTSEKFQSMYSNSVSFVTTPWDVRFVFGEVRPDATVEDSMVNERKVSVVMSHSHAKALLQILTAQIQSIEEDLGTIAYRPLSGESD
jgi:hypothetical protein